METNIIRWDKSMEARCLGRCWDTEAKSAAVPVPVPVPVSVPDEGGSTYDRQWVEFEKALDKALRQ